MICVLKDAYNTLIKVLTVRFTTTNNRKEVRQKSATNK